jgi:hypothetical protein
MVKSLICFPNNVGLIAPSTPFQIGCFTTTLRMLQASRNAAQPFALINPKKQDRMLYRDELPNKEFSQIFGHKLT